MIIHGKDCEKNIQNISIQGKSHEKASSFLPDIHLPTRDSFVTSNAQVELPQIE
jgi:hypothetical protein